MPLLRGKPFLPQRIPPDLKLDEDVFVCSQTNEVFRNYEDFFDRQYLCNTFVWSCQLTGQHNMTYQQALDSEREAKAAMDLLSEPHKEIILSLLHKTIHTNMRAVVDEITSFFKERFVVGEELDYYPTPGEKKLSRCVKVNNVSSTPVKKNSPPINDAAIPVASSAPVISAPVISTCNPSVYTPDPVSEPTPSSVVSTSCPVPVSDNIPVSTSCSSMHPGPSTPGPTSMSTPGPISMSTPGPISDRISAVSGSSVPRPHVSFYLSQKPLPMDYLYTVQDVGDKCSQFMTNCGHLNRPKSVLTKEKVKLFLKNALYRATDKHSLLVKPEYVEKYQLGPHEVVEVKHNLSFNSCSISQNNLDSFILSPTSSAKKQQMILSFFHPTGGKKVKSPQKKAPKTPSRTKSRTSISSVSSSARKISPGHLKAPIDSTASSTSIGAKKAIKKAKQMKQLDLRRSLIKTKDGRRLSQGDVRKDTRKGLLSNVERRRLSKLDRKRELRERKKLAKLREIEMNKPIEDTLCVDSKPLPSLSPVLTTLPPELFGDAVEALEFLHHYGPVYNIKEAIHTTVTFEKLEEALVSNHPDTILYGIIKFLLQRIFVSMEEEHEATVTLNKKKPDSVEGGNEDDGGQTGEGKIEGISCSSRSGSRRSSVGSIPVEGLEEERPLDVQVASLKVSATYHTMWPHLTQSTSLFKLAFDPYTCSEILRLHLLSCGGYKENCERNSFRYCSRGGYSDADDPVLEFRLTHSNVIDALGVTPIYDLPPSYKLQILSVLCLQLLGFASSRDYMEEIRDKSKSLRRQIRELQASLSEKKKRKTQNGEQVNKENVDDTKVTKQTTSQGLVPSQEKLVTETKEEQKSRVQQEIQELSHQLYPLTACLRLQPIGLDRYHNRYWHFHSLPGLFIECSQHTLQPTMSNSDKPPIDYLLNKPESLISADNDRTSSSLNCLVNSNSPSKLEVLPEATTTTNNNGQADEPISNTATALSTCLTRQQLISHPIPNLVWCSLSSQEEIDTLVGALNSRGDREVKLKESIQKMSPMFTSVSKCPVANTNYSTKDWSTSPLETNCNEYLELYLREQVLDLEEKIWAGNLGFIKDVKNRMKWKNAIESSGAASKYNHTSEDGALLNGYNTSDEMEVDDIDRLEVSSVQELVKAILQIQQGIEKKFLLPPLGTAVDLKTKGKDRKNGLLKVKDTDTCLEGWKASLLKATSFSQLFVHLSTLERAVAWSKSLMNVRCRICRRKGGDEYMLLCDGCDHGYHTYCLRPPVYDIPADDWFCYNCCPVTPMKRRTVSTVSMKEVSDSESESDAEEEEEEEEKEEDDSEEEEEEESEEVRRSLRSSTVVQRKRLSQPSKVATRSNSHFIEQKSSKVGGRKRGRPPKVKESSQVKKRLKLEDCDSNGGELSKAEAIISSIIDVRCSKVQGPAQQKALKTLEFQLSKALLDELTSHAGSWPFMTSVRRREYPDYYDVINQPMDFKTISQKISSHKYTAIDRFLCDIELIFANCSTYFKRKSKEACAGVAMKKFFDQRYSDLGLRSLMKNTRQRSSSVELRSSTSSRY